jgi:hypothetical protein
MSLKARLAAVEARLGTAEDDVRHYVLTVGEAIPADVRAQDTVLFLPEKFATAEAWAEAMRKQFGFLLDGPPYDNLDEWRNGR